MDAAYWHEFVHSVAWRVDQAARILCSGLVSDIDQGWWWVPLEPFRLAITISPTAGHDVLSGSITVNGEVIEFTEATRLTTQDPLTSSPTITVSGLDCLVQIACITSDGEPIMQETLVPIEVVIFPKTTIRRDPSGSGAMETNYNVYTDAPCKIGDRIKYADPHQGGALIDIYVKDVSSAVDLEDNSQPFRVLYCA